MPGPSVVEGRQCYPREALEQLRSNVKWLARGVRSVDARKFILWTEGFAIPLDEIRPLIARVVRDWSTSTAELLADALETSGAAGDRDVGSMIVAPPASLEALAIEVAGKRSLSPLPEQMRKRRMPKSEKVAAIRFALVSLLSIATTEDTQGASALDRMMGLDRRRKALRPLLLSEDPLSLQRAVAPARLEAGVAADDDELEFARRCIQIALRMGNAFVELMALECGPSVKAMTPMLEEVPARQVGPLLAFGVASIAGAIHENREAIDLSAALAEVEPEEFLGRFFSSLTKATERLAFRDGLAPSVQLELDRSPGLAFSRRSGAVRTLD